MRADPGATLIDACCGSTPAHIAAAAAQVRALLCTDDQGEQEPMAEELLASLAAETAEDGEDLEV